MRLRGGKTELFGAEGLAVWRAAAFAELEQALEEQQVVNDGLRYDLDSEDANSDEYAEKKARYELDYVKPGERVFYNVGGNN